MRLIKNALLVIFSIVLALMLLEFGMRWFGDDVRHREDDVNKVVQYHPSIGWVPKPGAFGTDIQGNRVTILADGTRSNGRVPPLIDERPVLAVGDSFVFGDEVADDETWPAQLEKKLGRRVINGGVNGYGLDQIVLRAKALLPIVEPGLLLVGLYPDDIPRCGLSVRHKPKPYFELEGEKLVLRNVPVPEVSPREWGWLGDLLLASRLMGMANVPRYLGLDDDAGMVFAHGDHEHVAALLLRDLTSEAKKRGVSVGILIQYNSLDRQKKEMVDRVLYYVKKGGYAKIMDMYYHLSYVYKSDKNEFDNLYINFTYNNKNMLRHMNKNGNSLVADFLVNNRIQSSLQ